MNKKPYVKPDFFFESFKLSVNISSGCAQSATHAEMMCGVDLGFDMLFVNPDICSITSVDMFDQVCYHVPTADTNIFES